MAQDLSKLNIDKLPLPDKSNKIYYDGETKKAVTGLGIRVTAKGAKSFILNYRTKFGTERRITIGGWGNGGKDTWTVAAAREYAKKLKKQVDEGGDPLKDIEDGRNAKTVADMCKRFEEDHFPKLKPSTRRNYASLIENKILPALRNKPLRELEYSDIDALHRKITRNGTGHQANRTVAVLSKMLNQSIRWKWIATNPATGIERNPEEPRERFLSLDEIERLSNALEAHRDPQAANIIRLLLLTGCRKGEALGASWSMFDESGYWVKPSSHTKQKKEHRVPLSAPARQLLEEIRAERPYPDETYVFPAPSESGHRVDIKKNWRELCEAAGLSGVRVHDLRHTFASVLVSGGQSLPVIGRLLGHTQTQTTQRYAHLFDDPLKAATESAGAVIARKPKGELFDYPEKGRSA